MIKTASSVCKNIFGYAGIKVHGEGRGNHAVTRSPADWFDLRSFCPELWLLETCRCEFECESNFCFPCVPGMFKQTVPCSHALTAGIDVSCRMINEGK